LLLVGALLAALLTGCTSTPGTPDRPDRPGGDAIPSLSPRTDNGAAEVTTESMVADLASVGIAVVDPDTGTAQQEVSGDPSPVTVSATELPAAVSGVQTLTGLSAAQVDGLATWPAIEGPVPQLAPSLLVAGWLVGASTSAATIARTYMGAQDPRLYADLVFPAAVLDLFLSDVLPRGDTGDAVTEPTASTAAYLRAASDQSVCEQFQSFITDKINQVFAAIGKLPSVSGGSIFADILNGVIDVLNLGKDALKFFLVEGTKVLLKPVVDAVASVASVVALASFAVKTVLPWSGEILPTPGAPVLGVAPKPGKWTLTLKSPGPQEWPKQVEGCARWAGVKLPSLRPRDATISWLVISQRPKTLISPGNADASPGADSTATMRWQTVTEDPKTAAGDAQYDGAVRVRATVHRTDLGTFTETLLKLFTNLLPSALPNVVKGEIAKILRPLLDEALGKLNRIRDLTVVGHLFPIYHTKKDETPPPPPPPGPGGSAFCQGFEKMLQFREASSSGGLDKGIAARQVAMLREIIPLGNQQQKHDGGVIATIWELYVNEDPTSPTANLGYIGQQMVALGYWESAQRIARTCNIALERIGAG